MGGRMLQSALDPFKARFGWNPPAAYPPQDDCANTVDWSSHAWTCEKGAAPGGIRGTVRAGQATLSLGMR
jgi:hypothetical protein